MISSFRPDWNTPRPHDSPIIHRWKLLRKLVLGKTDYNHRCPRTSEPNVLDILGWSPNRPRHDQDIWKNGMGGRHHCVLASCCVGHPHRPCLRQNKRQPRHQPRHHLHSFGNHFLSSHFRPIGRSKAPEFRNRSPRPLLLLDQQLVRRFTQSHKRHVYQD